MEPNGRLNRIYGMDNEIEQRIFLFRGVKVMLDRDLAELYGVTTTALKRCGAIALDSLPISGYD